jgi:ketosteroid isomerase-like protein
MTHFWYHLPGGKLSYSVAATAMVLLALVIYSSVAGQSQQGGDAELRNVMNVYAEAVNKADAQLGSQVWCGSEEDSLTNPAGHWQGAQQIKALSALLRDSYSERKLTFDTVSIHSYGDFAWTEFTGDFAAKQRKDGTPFSFHAAETQIYRKSHGKWCLVHVQYSTLPAQQSGERK